jgi:hypothetical protein
VLLHHDELKVPESLARMAIKLGMWKVRGVKFEYDAFCLGNPSDVFILTQPGVGTRKSGPGSVQCFEETGFNTGCEQCSMLVVH